VKRAPITLHQALTDRRLLGAALGDSASWSTWFAVLKAAHGEPLSPAERAAFDAVAGGREPPKRKAKQFVVVVSRRGGKGRMAAGLAVFEAAIVDHRRSLAPGEVGVVAVVSPTKAQSQVVKDYALGYFESSPILRGEVLETTNEEIRLSNGNVIATLTADYRSLRGRTLLLAILDEASFLPAETSMTPDVEAARAILPGLATTGGMLVILSSPYRKAGLLHQLHRDHFGKDSDDVLVVAGPSTAFNPTLDQDMIAAAQAADPEAAKSEWYGLFRSDVSALLDDQTIDAAVDRSRPLELPPRAGLNYTAFIDPSGGRHDAFTCVICHREGEMVIADVVRGRKAPFDPASASYEFADLIKQYGIRSVTGDAYSGNWVADAFRSCGLEYVQSELNRSELYLESLQLFTRGMARIPDHADLLRELRQLERRTSRTGKDSVDHPQGGHDDFANALCGALVLASTHRPFIVTTEMLASVMAAFPPRGPHIGRRIQPIFFPSAAQRG
jgi:hypothetical protein